MSDWPSRTVEVVLDEDSVKVMMKAEKGAAAFSFSTVRDRFREHLKAKLSRKLRESPGARMLEFAGRWGSGTLRLFRREKGRNAP